MTSAATCDAEIAPPSLPGAVDVSFNSEQGPDNVVHGIAPQRDGHILVRGAFGAINGVSARRFARLTRNGEVDTEFTSRCTPEGGPISQFGDATAVLGITPLTDDKTVIGGNFNLIGSISRAKIARLNPDGALDLTFDPGTGPVGGIQDPVHGDLAAVFCVAPEPDGKLVVGGTFTKFDGHLSQDVVRLNTDGSFDASFAVTPGCGGGIWDDLYGHASQVRAIAAQRDGRIVLGGSFETVNGEPRQNLARLEADGSLDRAFASDVVGTHGETVTSVLIQPDGMILISGAFTNVNNQPVNNLARLKADGRLDDAFKPSLKAESVIRQTALLPDGKIVIVGSFAALGDIPRNQVARLNPDGSVDTTFDPQPGPSVSSNLARTDVRCVASDFDANLLMGGSFNEVSSIRRNFVVRLFGGLNATANGLKLSDCKYENGVFSVTVPTSIGTTYSLESTGVQGQPVWTPVQTVVGDATYKVFTDLRPRDSHKIYRVRAQ